MNQYEAMQYAGVVLAVAGIAFVFWPAALMVAGGALILLAQAGAR